MNIWSACVVSFKSFVVCACFAKGISGECDDFYWLFFNGFWKWQVLQMLRRKGCRDKGGRDSGS